MQRLTAVRALGSNAAAYLLSSYQPLHEGHRYRVHRSSRIDLLTRAEVHAMRRPLDCYGIGPGHCPVFIPEEKSHVPFEIFENGLYPGKGQVQILPYALRGYRSPQAGKFAYSKISHQVVFRRHETKTGF